MEKQDLLNTASRTYIDLTEMIKKVIKQNKKNDKLPSLRRG